MCCPETEEVMRRERGIQFLLFVVSLVAAMPLSWGAGSLKDLNPVGPASRNDGVNTDASIKVTLCHIPPGNPADAQTITVGHAAVPAHLAHGDYLGECHPECASVPSAVPKTGQTKCWDTDGVSVSCAGTGQDGESQKGVAVDPRFTDNLDGTVKDNLTGLIWLKDANCFDLQTWTNALSHANTLASGACGLTDGSVAGAWRLPNVKELQTLIDFSQSLPALPPGNPFSGVQIRDYWSSTTSVNNPNSAWLSRTFDGAVNVGPKALTFYVWPVRGGR
jgi:hypothetical protein